MSSSFGPLVLALGFVAILSPIPCVLGERRIPRGLSSLAGFTTFMPLPMFLGWVLGLAAPQIRAIANPARNLLRAIHCRCGSQR